VGELMEAIDMHVWDSPDSLMWPPDVFALAAAVLHRSGGYRLLARAWPPSNPTTRPVNSAVGWAKAMRQIGIEWRRTATAKESPPGEIVRWWKQVSRRRKTPIDSVSANRSLCEALLQLCAAADEACEGVGIAASADSVEHSLEMEANLILDTRGATLCKRVDPSRARVLPKLHAPKTGLTIRSISHNLALFLGGEVEPKWYRLPVYQPKSSIPDGSHSLNLLIVPWPEAVTPAQFRAEIPKRGSLPNMPATFGFFRYVLPEGQEPVTLLKGLLSKARTLVGRIDGVVFPELALTPTQHAAISLEVLSRGAFLIAGVAQASPQAGQPGMNSLSFDIPISEDLRVQLSQFKHHRWKLDRGQISQYGLGTELDPRSEWWEHISLQRRTLTFVSMRPWLTTTALICEDLARQDPVAELVRAVGPNLVIALLLDAPQLASRWPARYAIVLADDPGCSVLTVTSKGMAELSKPFRAQSRPRVIALWKDATSGDPVEIELPTDKRAVVLNLTVEDREEFTADGRSDEGATGYPVLSGIHFV